MLRLAFITIHPEFLESYTQFGVFRSAIENRLAEVTIVDLRRFSVDRHGSVDERPYGGGDGMIMRPEPLAQAVQALTEKYGEKPYVILTSPQGQHWHQRHAQTYSGFPRPIVFVCGRFGGIDQRFIDLYVHSEYSCGDFVGSGGELPALMFADSCLRLVPGVLGHAESAHSDSFADGFRGGLEHPQYTRPQQFQGVAVPEILMSGDHKKIKGWRSREALRQTIQKRPDLTPDISPAGLLKN